MRDFRVQVLDKFAQDLGFSIQDDGFGLVIVSERERVVVADLYTVTLVMGVQYERRRETMPPTVQEIQKQLGAENQLDFRVPLG